MKSVITIALFGIAFLAIAPVAHTSPATDIDTVRGIIAAKDLPTGVKTVEKSVGDEPWELTTLQFNYDDTDYTLSLYDGEGLEILSDKVVYQGHVYTIVDEGVSPYAESPCHGIDGIPDTFTVEGKMFGNSNVKVSKRCQIILNDKTIHLSPETEKALSNRYTDDLLALVKYYASMKMSKN